MQMQSDMSADTKAGGLVVMLGLGLAAEHAVLGSQEVCHHSGSNKQHTWGLQLLQCLSISRSELSKHVKEVGFLTRSHLSIILNTDISAGRYLARHRHSG